MVGQFTVRGTVSKEFLSLFFSIILFTNRPPTKRNSLLSFTCKDEHFGAIVCKGSLNRLAALASFSRQVWLPVRLVAKLVKFGYPTLQERAQNPCTPYSRWQTKQSCRKLVTGDSLLDAFQPLSSSQRGLSWKTKLKNNLVLGIRQCCEAGDAFFGRCRNTTCR